MATVQDLKQINFSQLTLEDKLKIKSNGRPVPPINLIQSSKCKGRERNRTFKDDTYEKYVWMCGCSETDRLFCFPCLLFSNEKGETWTNYGCADVGHLKQKALKHENSKAHINAELELSVLGRYNISEQLDSAFRRNIEKQNAEVTKNRYVLSQIIICVKFCGAFELALRGHDESHSSLNPGIFRGFINFTSELDSAMKDHLENSTVFKGTSKQIQNELLQCMLDVCKTEIKSEISKAEYVSIMADETSDVSSLCQMVIVLRYLLPDGKPVERFWTFMNPKGQNVQALANCVKEVLEEVILDKTKVISQSYDGANVMGGAHSGVQNIIKEEYPFAHYVHCYAHKLNLIMSQATSQNTQVRIFFSDLHEIPAFFSHSTQRVKVLDEIVGKRIPAISNVRWNFKSRLVETVYEHRDALADCFEEIEVTSRQGHVISQARGLRFKLEQPDFNFWLEIFHLIMPHVDILYNQLQSQSIDSVSANTAIVSFRRAIETVRERVDSIAEMPHYNCTGTKRRRLGGDELSRKVAAKEVCDVVIMQAGERFAFTGHLEASKLFASVHFAQYDKQFPEKFFLSACESYPFIEKSRLRTELEILYMRDDFRRVSSAMDLLEFIIQNNIQRAFAETFKLLKIIVTIPMSTSEAERCFSTLKRVKTFLRSTMGEDRLCALAMLSIEKSLVTNIANFNEKVIDSFAEKKERRMNFRLRHIQ